MPRVNRDHSDLPAIYTFIHKWNEPSCLYFSAAKLHKLISHPTEDRRLSWHEWLITYRDGTYRRKETVTHLSTNRARRRVTSLIRPTPLPLRHASTCIANLNFLSLLITKTGRYHKIYKGSEMTKNVPLSDVISYPLHNTRHSQI